jgi:CubicO group peptidase (beta-lactamase class C family)
MEQQRPVMTRRRFIASSSLVLAGSFAPRLAFAGEVRWPGVARAVEDNVRSGRLGGAVALLGFGQGEGEAIASGYRSMGLPGAIDADSLFRIYSMTKPITGMAAMMLVDEGRLDLDQPLADILPQFAKMNVQRVADGAVEDCVAADRPITIRHLLTHTSGLGYTTEQNGPIKQAYEKAGLVPGLLSKFSLPGFSLPEPVQGLAAFADRLATMPLVYQPGTKWSYSVGLDLMGRVIEVVSGQAFDAFLQERLFDPLGMASTFFRVPEREAARLTSNYGVKDGLLLPIDPAPQSVFLDPPPFSFGGSGLVSSPRDYDRFLRMLLGTGLFEGKRVMSERAVRLGTSNLLPGGISTAGTMANSGGFGAGGRVGVGAEEGTFGWGGAAGTIAFADLKRGWRGGFYAQYMPSSAWPVQKAFPEIAMKDAMQMMHMEAAA